MAKIQSTRAMADKVWLQRSEGRLSLTRARLDRDDDYATAFRQAADDLFAELWPVDEPVDGAVDWAAYLAIIADDIDRVPLDLLDDLVAALARQTGGEETEETPQHAAARVLGGWLRARGAEHRTDGPVLQQARALKQDHADLFRDLLAGTTVAAHQIAAETHPRGIRLDELS